MFRKTSKIIFTLTFFVLLSTCYTFAEEVKFTAQAYRTTVAIGDKFQLVYSVNASGEDFRLPTLKDFSILMGPSTKQSSGVQIINGKVTQNVEYSFTYVIKANKEGTYTIPAAQIIVDGKKYNSNTLSITVVKQVNKTQNQKNNNTQAGDTFSKDDLFIKVIPNKTNVYQGQPLVLTTKLYTKVSIESLSDIKHPNFKNFLVEKMDDNQRTKWHYESINGYQYNVTDIEKQVLFPQRSGKLTIDAIEAEFTIKQRISRRSRSLFDDFFGENYRLVKKRVSSTPVKINVKPYNGKQPADFSGGVGTFKMNVTTTKTNIKASEGITIKAKISGTGNLKLISAPKIDFPSDFDQYDPQTTNNLSLTTSGHKGTKTFEYLIIPQYGGSYDLDPITFTYFDIASGSFKTLKSDPLHIEVEKDTTATQSGGTQFIGTSNRREDIQFLGKDIRFIKTSNLSLKNKGTFLYGSIPFWLGYIGSFLLFIIVFVLNQKRIHDNANTHLVKNKMANKNAKKRLRKSAQLLQSGDQEAFYDEVLKALTNYICDKLIMPVSEYTKDNTTQQLLNKGVSKEVIDEFMNIMDTCEFARFSPSAESDQMDKTYQNAVKNISLLDSQVKK